MTQKTKHPKLNEPKKVGVLAGMLLFVIKGLRTGSISSKPILKMDDEATEYETATLDQEIWDALGKCGINEEKL